MVPIIYAAEAALSASFKEELREIWVSVGASTLLLTAFVAFLILILVYHGFFSKTKYFSVVIIIGLAGSLLLSLSMINKKMVLVSQARAAATPQGVFVERVTKNSVVISWQTANLSTGFVRYGPLPEKMGFLGLDLRKNLPVRSHKVWLENLEPDTVYYYVIVSEGVVFDKGGKPLTFTTFAP